MKPIKLGGRFPKFSVWTSNIASKIVPLPTALTILAATLAGPAHASNRIFEMDFTGVATTSNITSLGDFYNSGFSGDGNQGRNYGVSFTGSPLVYNNYNGSGEPDSAEGKKGILVFSTIMVNYSPGWIHGISFYSAADCFTNITVFDGLDGTGNIVAQKGLFPAGNLDCPPGATGYYCNWTRDSLPARGFARSVSIAFTTIGAIDNFTIIGALGSVPEVGTWVQMLIGFGLVGATIRRRTAVSLQAIDQGPGLPA